MRRERSDDSFQGGGEDEMRLLRRLALAVWRASFWITSVAILAAACAVGASYLSEVNYTATAKVKLYTRVENSQDYSPDTSGLPTTLTSLESELEVLRSTDLIERVIVALDLTNNETIMANDAGGFNLMAMLRGADDVAPDAAAEDELPDAKMELAITRIQDSRDVVQVGSASAVYAISVTSPDRHLAAKITNEIAREYLRTQTNEKLRSLELSQAWLADRTIELQTTLNALVTGLESAQLESPFSPEEYATIKAQRLIALRDIRTIDERLDSINTTIAAIRAVLSADDPRGLLDVIENPSAALVAQLTRASASDMTVVTAEANAAIGALTREQDALMQQKQQTQARIEVLRESQAIQGEHDAEIRRIENDIAVNEAIYRDFVAQLSRRTETNQYLDADASIIEIARPPQDPSSPNRKSIGFLTLLAAGLISLGYVLYREIFETRLRTSDEIEDALQLPLYGFMAHVADGNSLIKTVVEGSEPVKPVLMGSARRLQVSLDAVLERQTGPSSGRAQSRDLADGHAARGKIIAGAAAIAGEGVSTSLLLAARASAISGEKVLLLDCNVEDSAYHAFMVTDADLSHGGKSDQAHSVIRPAETHGPDILPVSSLLLNLRDNGDLSAFFATAQFKDFLHDMTKQYDKIFIDVPPVLATMEAVSLLSLADAVLYFVRWNATSRNDVKATVDILRSASITPAFAVVTQIKLDKVGRYGDASLAAVSKARKVAAR